MSSCYDYLYTSSFRSFFRYWSHRRTPFWKTGRPRALARGLECRADNCGGVVAGPAQPHHVIVIDIGEVGADRGAGVVGVGVGLGVVRGVLDGLAGDGLVVDHLQGAEVARGAQVAHLAAAGPPTRPPGAAALEGHAAEDAGAGAVGAAGGADAEPDGAVAGARRHAARGRHP